MAVGYLLDTNIISYLIKGQDTGLVKRISQLDESKIFISSATYYELCFGLIRQFDKAGTGGRFQIIQLRMQQWMSGMNVVPFDGQAALAAARLNAGLLKKGRVMQQPDMFIAAQAIARGLVLISHDHRAFEGLRAEGLLWEDWCSV